MLILLTYSCFVLQGTDIQITQESNRNQKKDIFLVEKDQTSLKMTSAVTSVNDASKGDIEKTVTEAEISEHLSGVSADFPGHKQDYLDERTVNSEYSEDFEKSPSTTGRESVSEVSEELSESCMYSGKHPSSASSPLFTREQQDQVRRVTVKETAVQTVDPPFTYCWSKSKFTRYCPIEAIFTYLYFIWNINNIYIYIKKYFYASLSQP